MTLLLVMLHGLILMCQGMAFSVAMNSKRNNALVALIIATNFVEIKGEPFPSQKPHRGASASPSVDMLHGLYVADAPMALAKATTIVAFRSLQRAWHWDR